FYAVILFRESVRNGIRELVRLTEDWPFLSKTRCDLARAVGEIDRNIQYVLHHARLLIISFFDEERVVLDSFSERLGGDRSTRRRQGTCYDRDASDDNQDACVRFWAHRRAVWGTSVCDV